MDNKASTKNYHIENDGNKKMIKMIYVTNEIRFFLITIKG